MKRFVLLSVLLVCLSSFISNDSVAVKNFYNIPETLTFNKIDFKLSDSYHPNDHYYKQEYLPSGQSPDHFNSMLIIDFYVTDAPNKKLAELKQKELNERKKTDVIANYEQFENADLGEYILDFILSDGNGDKLNVVEHNIYHYANYVDKSGHKGIIVFGICTRGYGDDILSFIKSVKENKNDNINKLSSYPLPKIELN